MVLAATEIPAAPVLIFMALGVLIAIFGHASKSRTLIVTGIMILFMATAAMVAGAYVAYQNEGEGTEDPRPKRDPREPTF
jgi:uncharacterized protein YqgC (DUF456 family)